jgi:glycosyltransferase involved in cell wall biosynthesis
MRIAVVTETYPPEINGVALTVAGFVEQLTRQGHEILLVRPRQDGVPDAAPAARETLVAGAGIPRYPGLRFGLPATRRLRADWSTERPDAIYIATEGPLGWSALRAAESLGIPVATGFHTRFDDYFAHYGAAWLTPAVSAWQRRFHNRADATLVPTRELQDQLRARGYDRVRRLARGVDTTQFSPRHRDAALRADWALDEHDLAVLFVGRIAPEKNLELVVRAFDAIRAARPGARMVWVGEGPALPALRDAHPHHVFCGLRRDGDLACHFASGDVFLFPSETETFGNVTLEAMASGVPPVAYDYGAAREHLRDGIDGRSVPTGDAAAFVAAAVELATDDALRVRMRASAPAQVAGLSPAAVAAELAALLASLRLRRAA